MTDPRHDPRMKDRTFLRKFKQPIGARCARGKEYLDRADAVRIGNAIEKRAAKALKRLAQSRPTTTQE